MPAVVSVDNVSKKFLLHHQRARSFQDILVNFAHRRNGTTEEFWALKGVTFEVQRGEALGIVGTNGSGKSTVLKLITRILDPTSGSVTTNGRLSALIELGAGFHPDLTGRENIYLNGSILGFSRREMDARFDEILAFSELERFIDTPVKHFSSGMYMRLGFSVATSVDPDILIIDEVLAVGDEAFQRKCLERIDQFRRQGKTIILVSHGNELVERMCDRAVWLDHGIVRAKGPVHQAIQAYVAEMRERDEKAREIDQATSVTAVERDLVATTGTTAEIRGVSLSAADGSDRYSFQSGETMRVQILYRFVDADPSYSISAQVRRSDGLLLYSTTARHDLGARPNEAGDYRIELRIPRLQLLSGTYEVIPSIQRASDAPAGDDPGAIRCRFSVWSDPEQIGLVALDGQWRTGG
jgi:ABC-type polysaccharide/polyol phosphate transport system ATPase subunit